MVRCVFDFSDVFIVEVVGFAGPAVVVGKRIVVVATMMMRRVTKTERRPAWTYCFHLLGSGCCWLSYWEVA